MNCIHHQDRPAVASCANCGAGICHECFNRTEYTLDDKPLCRNCNRQLILKMISDIKKERVRLFIFTPVIFILVLIAGLSWYVTRDSSVLILFIFIGFPVVWRNTKRTQHEKELDYLRDGLDDDGGLARGFVRIVVRFLIAFIGGMIVGPFLLFFNIIRLVKGKNRLKALKKQLAEIETQ